MSKATLVGKSKYDFFNDKNERVAGVKLHIVCYDERVYGNAALQKSIKIDHPLYQEACDLPLGEIDIQYGRKDSVEGFTVIKPFDVK